jgi:hypothetical protein
MNVGDRVKVVKGTGIGKSGIIMFEAERKDISGAQLPTPKGFWIEAADGSDFFKTEDQLEIEE